MKLKEIFEQLTYGELSQLSLGGGEMGGITEANYPKILAHINLGLTTLYTRFPLKESSIALQLKPHLVRYTLSNRFAVSNARSQELDKYILDTSAWPFADDLIKIDKVITDAGHDMHLNNSADKYSAHTPSFNVLVVPEDMVTNASDLPDWLKTNQLAVVYRANHPKIVQSMTYFDPERVEVQLPDSYLELLLLFIASRVHNPIGMTNEFHAGNSYSAKFEQACQQRETYGIRVDKDSQNTRLERNGWI